MSKPRFVPCYSCYPTLLVPLFKQRPPVKMSECRRHTRAAQLGIKKQSWPKAPCICFWHSPASPPAFAYCTAQALHSAGEDLSHGNLVSIPSTMYCVCGRAAYIPSMNHHSTPLPKSRARSDARTVANGNFAPTVLTQTLSRQYACLPALGLPNEPRASILIDSHKLCTLLTCSRTANILSTRHADAQPVHMAVRPASVVVTTG